MAYHCSTIWPIPPRLPVMNALYVLLFAMTDHDEPDHLHRAQLFDTLDIQSSAFHILDRATIDVQAMDQLNEQILPVLTKCLAADDSVPAGHNLYSFLRINSRPEHRRTSGNESVRSGLHIGPRRAADKIKPFKL